MNSSPFSDQTLLTCKTICFQSGSNFTPIFGLLPRMQREAMIVLYAFMRVTDDIADRDQDFQSRFNELQSWKKQLGEALSGGDGNPMLVGMREVLKHFPVEASWLFEVISGVEKDLAFCGFANALERDAYCYQVASVVGLCCVAIWKGDVIKGHTPALDTGFAFQRTNILRDLKEDFTLGRCYLPKDLLFSFGIGSHGPTDQKEETLWDSLIRFEIGEIEKLFASGKRLKNYLPRGGRAVFGGFMELYHSLLQKIAKDPSIVWRERVRVSSTQKASILFRAFCLKWFGF